MLIRRAALLRRVAVGVEARRLCSHGVRVRFAPSPTGPLHLGGLRTALYNYLFARANGGAFVLRVEDTDQARCLPGAEAELTQLLHWAGLSPDESPEVGGPYGPYRQSERLGVYQAAARELLSAGFAYPCFCSSRTLRLLKESALREGSTPRYDNRCRAVPPSEAQARVGGGAPHVIRFRLRDELPNGHRDLVYGVTRHEVGSVEGDPVLLKSDGRPTYHLASVVDDRSMRVTHVLRGAEWLVSTSKHLQIHHALAHTDPHGPAPRFGHLPLIMGADGQKLSKRRGDGRVARFRDDGLHPHVLLQLLTRCGGGFAEGSDTSSLEALVLGFSVSRVSTHSALLDLDKIPDIARQHLSRQLEDPVSLSRVVSQLEDLVSASLGLAPSPGLARRLLLSRKGHVSGVSELVSPAYAYVWRRPSVSAAQMHAVNPHYAIACQCALRVLCVRDEEGEVEAGRLSALLRSDLEANRTGSFPAAMRSLRLALTGNQTGPSVADIILCLGLEESRDRVQRILTA